MDKNTTRYKLQPHERIQLENIHKLTHAGFVNDNMITFCGLHAGRIVENSPSFVSMCSTCYGRLEKLRGTKYKFMKL